MNYVQYTAVNASQSFSDTNLAVHVLAALSARG